ncbi:MAG: glycosyltransferase [Opitutaceae bacterium]|nr:glycosyltransferase [Opitutaceae bacterium]
MTKREIPRITGKHLAIGGEPFLIKGVTYGTFAANDEGEPYPPHGQMKEDFARMADTGINTVRLYTPPSDRMADLAAASGLFLIPDICWGPRTCEWDYVEWWKKAVDRTAEQARRLRHHPALLMFSIGNEIPPLMVRWYGRARTEEYLRVLYDAVKAEAPESIVTYVNHPPTEYLNLPFLDVLSFNVYLNRESDFRSYLARLHSLAGDRPLFLGELGFDSQEFGDAEQARYLAWQLRAVFEKGLCGAAVYAWTDEWTIFDSQISGWSFGLTTADRRPKPALAAVRKVFSNDIYRLRSTPWPKVSVVVAAYNGAATLDECLAGIARLEYPDYELIVIDDGSTDETAAIAVRHGVQPIRVPNGGLSRARNLGIEAAKGEIVAFIDSDAYPDPHWLYYVVTALEEKGGAAVGGPNLIPPGVGFVEECVDCAPGNPTHVLLDDERAEHIPGCNMAYRKSALLEIGNFDPTHRAAGDDVDVCWKLLVRGHTIAFSPSGVVFHHRRPTVKAFLKQQKGYGYAEAHLQRRYPGRYNFFGHQVWRGHVYDTVSHSIRQHGLPLLFQSRVYQGSFCGEQFQSVYQPFLNWWIQIFTAIEWQVVTLGLLLSGALGLAIGGTGTVVALALGGIMLALSIASAILCARHACYRKPWRGATRFRGTALVAFLHFVQPLSRAAGRLRGWWAERGTQYRYPASQRLYGNLLQRAQLLEGLQEHLRMCGWIGRPADEWSEHDLEIPGPGPYRLFITTVYEDDVAHSVHYLRYRITAEMKWFAPVVVAGIVLALAGIALAPAFLPLAPALLFIGRKFLTAKRSMINAISQLTTEYAGVLGMTKAQDDF